MASFSSLSNNENDGVRIGLWKKSGQDGVFIDVFFVAVDMVFGFDGNAIWVISDVGADSNTGEKVGHVNLGALVRGGTTNAKFSDSSGRFEDAVKFGNSCLTVDGVDEADGFDQGFHIAHGHSVLVAGGAVYDDQTVFFGAHAKEGGAAVKELGGAEFGP